VQSVFQTRVSSKCICFHVGRKVNEEDHYSSTKECRQDVVNTNFSVRPLMVELLERRANICYDIVPRRDDQEVQNTPSGVELQK